MDQTSSKIHWLSAKLEQLWGIDLRSLAAFRICLGLLVLLDLFNRSFSLADHYTDWGLMSRQFLIESASRRWQISLHLCTGTTEGQALIFLIHALFAAMLLIGWHTRLATILTWLLTMSLQHRNLMVNNGGDDVLRLLLFWAMFLPVGARYSVDYAMRSKLDNPANRLVSGATVAIIIQICLIYWFNAVHKYDPIWRSQYTATYYALALDQFTTPLGQWLKQFHGLLKILTFLTWHLELWGPVLLFVPFWTARIRTALILVFYALHLGFMATMEIGLFPAICMSAWIIFLPSALWDRLAERINQTESRDLVIYYDGECGFCHRLVRLLRTIMFMPDVAIRPAQGNQRLNDLMHSQQSWIVVDRTGTEHLKFEAFVFLCRASIVLRPVAWVLGWAPMMLMGERIYDLVARRRHFTGRLTAGLAIRPLRITPGWVGTIVALLAITYISLWNVREFFEFRGSHDPQASKYYERIESVFPESWNNAAWLLGLDQYWRMFSPYPSTDDGWYVIPARLSNGAIVDLWRGGKPVDWSKPALGSALYADQRWRKYMMNIWQKSMRHHREPFASYLCRKWNSSHPSNQQVTNLVIYFMREDTLADYRESIPKPVRLRYHYCETEPPNPERDLGSPPQPPGKPDSPQKTH